MKAPNGLDAFFRASLIFSIISCVFSEQVILAPITLESPPFHAFYRQIDARPRYADDISLAPYFAFYHMLMPHAYQFHRLFK